MKDLGCKKCDKSIASARKIYRCSSCRAYFCASCMDRFCLFCKGAMREYVLQE